MGGVGVPPMNLPLFHMHIKICMGSILICMGSILICMVAILICMITILICMVAILICMVTILICMVTILICMVTILRSVLRTVYAAEISADDLDFTQRKKKRKMWRKRQGPVAEWADPTYDSTIIVLSPFFFYLSPPPSQHFFPCQYLYGNDR